MITIGSAIVIMCTSLLAEKKQLSIKQTGHKHYGLVIKPLSVVSQESVESAYKLAKKDEWKKCWDMCINEEYYTVPSNS